MFLRFFDGGDDRDRTDYLLNAIQALSQVSYAPKYYAQSLCISAMQQHCQHAEKPPLFYINR